MIAFLQPNELPRFFEALANEPNEGARDFIMLSLLTGARKSNTLAMRWKDVNLSECPWRIEETKNSNPHTIHLPKQTMEILTARKLASDGAGVRANFMESFAL